MPPVSQAIDALTVAGTSSYVGQVVLIPSFAEKTIGPQRALVDAGTANIDTLAAEYTPAAIYSKAGIQPSGTLAAPAIREILIEQTRQCTGNESYQRMLSTRTKERKEMPDLSWVQGKRRNTFVRVSHSREATTDQKDMSASLRFLGYSSGLANLEE